MANGRCRMHGGKSTGPRTAEGLERPRKARLKHAIDKTRDILGVPEDYLCGIVPASDTGAFELAMWSMLGARGVDMLAWWSGRRARPG